MHVRLNVSNPDPPGCISFRGSRIRLYGSGLLKFDPNHEQIKIFFTKLTKLKVNSISSLCIFSILDLDPDLFLTIVIRGSGSVFIS